MRRWTVDQGQAGERLDRLVARRFAVARNQVQQWIRDGYVTVDGTPRRTSYAVRHGEEIACEPQAKQTAANLTPEDEDLTLLHEDPHLVVVDKPAGLAVHPGLWSIDFLRATRSSKASADGTGPASFIGSISTPQESSSWRGPSVPIRRSVRPSPSAV